MWIRYTVHKRPGEAPTGSLWFTLFDRSAGGPRAVKQTFAEVGAAADEQIHVGDAVMGFGTRLGARRGRGATGGLGPDLRLARGAAGAPAPRLDVPGAAAADQAR